MGMAGFTLFSLLPAWQLRPRSRLERALWTTGQIGAGLAMIFVAQFIAVVRIAPEDEKISFKDVVIPFRLWSLVCKRLPRTRLMPGSAAGGLTLIVCALLLIGGLPYWMNYLPGGKLNNGKKGQSTSQRN